MFEKMLFLCVETDRLMIKVLAKEDSRFMMQGRHGPPIREKNRIGSPAGQCGL